MELESATLFHQPFDVARPLKNEPQLSCYPPWNGGGPYLQHRVATLLVQHGRRHQNHPPGNPFLKSCRFRLCLVQGAVVNLFVLNLVCFIFVCPCIPETGRLENTYSCCGFWLWSWVAAVVDLFVLDLLRFVSVCLYPKRADYITRTYREETKKTLPRRPGHVAPRGAFSCRCANSAILNATS